MNALPQISWTLATACVLSRASFPSTFSKAATLRSRCKRPVPSWRLLYIMLSVTVGLLAVTEKMAREGAWRHFSEFLAVLAIFGGMAMWIRANRVALAEADGCSCPEREIEIRMVGEPQREGADYVVVLAADGRLQNHGPAPTSQEQNITTVAPSSSSF